MIDVCFAAMIAFFVLAGALAIMGIVCCAVQCVWHVRTIRKYRKGEMKCQKSTR